MQAYTTRPKRTLIWLKSGSREEPQLGGSEGAPSGSWLGASLHEPFEDGRVAAGRAGEGVHSGAPIRSLEEPVGDFRKALSSGGFCGVTGREYAE